MSGVQLFCCRNSGESLERRSQRNKLGEGVLLITLQRPTFPSGSGLVRCCSLEYSFWFSLSRFPQSTPGAVYIYSSSSIFSLHSTFTPLFPHFSLAWPPPILRLPLKPAPSSRRVVYFSNANLFFFSPTANPHVSFGWFSTQFSVLL
jgi:hypothetical protein